MDSTSVYGLELLALEGTGGKSLATDHRDCRKFWIKVLKETSLGVAQAFFLPLKKTILIEAQTN